MVHLVVVMVKVAFMVEIMMTILTIMKIKIMAINDDGDDDDDDDDDYRSIKYIYSCIRNLSAVLELVTRRNNLLV
jgi:hypothetical protein